QVPRQWPWATDSRSSPFCDPSACTSCAPSMESCSLPASAGPGRGAASGAAQPWSTATRDTAAAWRESDFAWMVCMSSFLGRGGGHGRRGAVSLASSRAGVSSFPHGLEAAVARGVRGAAHDREHLAQLLDARAVLDGARQPGDVVLERDVVVVHEA